MIAVNFFAVEREDAREQTHDEHVFAAVPGGSSDRLDSRARDGNADIGESLVGSIRLDFVRVIDADAAVAERMDVVIVAVLIERHQEVGIVPWREHFAGTDMNLEN